MSNNNNNNNTTTTTAAAAPAAPSAPAPVAPWDALRTSLSLAGAGKTFAKPSEAFDALAAFAKSAGHPFQPSRAFRDNILRLVSLSGKGKASGLSVKWSVGFSFGSAGKDYVAGGMDAEDKAGRKAEVDSMKSAGALWKAVGGLSFELEA